MKKKRAAQSAFLNVRTSIAVLLCATAVCWVLSATVLALFRPEAAAKVRTLSFSERVAYQRAIEEVYWRHRIWPKERPDPKPSLDAVMPQTEIEKKVEGYLRDSQALEDYWHRPLTPEELQAEIDRMVSHTRQSEGLREVFEALGNDPFVIAECVARPTLVERLSTTVFDQRTRGELEQGAYTDLVAHLRVEPGTVASLRKPLDYRGSRPVKQTTEPVEAPSGRYLFPSDIFNTGGRYNAATDTWTATSITNAPSARRTHTAVWIGSEMIVWGGFNESTGGRYNPITDSWIATSNTNAPSARDSHTAVWTGTEMIVWGGLGSSNTLNTGGRYNPVTDSWTATSTTNTPSARYFHTAVWTGSEMIIWGGDPGVVNTGGRYDPSTDSWIATSAANAPDPRDQHTAVWTGSEMIIWGGYNTAEGYLNTGGKYDPNTDSWIATSTNNALARGSHTAVWTGTEMIVWAGIGTNFANTNTGGRYNPGTDNWTVTTTTNAPFARTQHTAVWTGTEMIAWGGQGPGPTPTVTPRPTPTPRSTPPTRPRPTPPPRP